MTYSSMHSKNKTPGTEDSYKNSLIIWGLSNEIRKERFNKKVDSLSRHGWTLISQNQVCYIITLGKFERLDPPSLKARAYFLKEKYGLKKCLALFLFILLFLTLFGKALFVLFLILSPVALLCCWDILGLKKKILLSVISILGVLIITKWINDDALLQSERESIKRHQEQRRNAQRYNVGSQAAISLKNLLRNNGINESLILDVKTDSNGTLVIVFASNLWLSRPKYEQKQMRQTIKLLLQQIVQPNGWGFYLVDYMGNTI